MHAIRMASCIYNDVCPTPQVFDVRWKVYEPEVFYAADHEVEGIRISSRTHASDQRITCQWFGKRINDSEVRPFQFSRVHLTGE